MVKVSIGRKEVEGGSQNRTILLLLYVSDAS